MDTVIHTKVVDGVTIQTIHIGLPTDELVNRAPVYIPADTPLSEIGLYLAGGNVANPPMNDYAYLEAYLGMFSK